MPSPLPAGLLFDLDGTLVETDPTHLAAFNDILGPYGITVDEHFYNANIIGFPNADIFMRILPGLTVADHMRLADEKEALFRSRAGGLKPAHGLLDLLDRADASGVATIVVTNAPRANALMMLGALGITDRFRGMIIGDEMANPKPHPEPYLVGLERLGASTDHAVAFEDSRSGVRSAAAAGLSVVGMSTSLDAEALKGAGAHIVARDFTDPGLISLVRERTGMA
jgi:HAD superfamily hydrolase (TIGR01509 family)